MPKVKQILCGACLVTLVATCIAAWHLHRDGNIWTPDGAIYLRMTTQDRGVLADSARKASNRFMLEKLDRSDPHANPSLYAEHPPQFYVDQFALFRNRPLYPLLSALVYPAFGPIALKLVSAIAYVLTVVVMFALLLLVTSPLMATLGALVFGTQPIVLNFAAIDATDELALFFWTCALGAIIAYQRRPSTLVLVGICLASIALTLTRPAFPLPIGAAVGAYGAMRRSFRTITAVAPLLAATPAALVYFAYTASVHGPGVAAQLHWLYAWQHSIHAFGAEHGPVAWYISALLIDAYQMAILAVPELGGIILVLLALLGARSYRDNGTARIAIVSVATISIMIFLSPVDDVEPHLLLPMAPLIVLLAVVGLERFRVRGRNMAEAP